MSNIVIAGVGGQGLVLASGIIAEVALQAGLDVKTNDIVGLSQRGGTVWGSARISEVVHSPNIPIGEGDVLLGMEPLEALRKSYLMRKGSTIIINTKETYPTPALLEKEEYPHDDIKNLKNNFRVIEVDAQEEARAAGNVKAANTILLGLLAKNLDIDKNIWEDVISKSVPVKAIDENIKAFRRGYDFA